MDWIVIYVKATNNMPGRARRCVSRSLDGMMGSPRLANCPSQKTKTTSGLALDEENHMAYSNPALNNNDLVLRKKILSLREHYDLLDLAGTKLGEADGNLVQFPPKFVVVDTNGQELMRLGGKVLSVHRQFTIFDNLGVELGTIRKKIVKLIGEEYWIEKDGNELMRIFGNFTEHDYQMQSNGAQVALVHKKWFTVRDQLGVSITGNVDHRLAIGAVIVIEHVEVTEREK
ncbi:MAG: LURP-one-related family protein [Methanomassiliicoccales archaeon]